MKKKTIAALLAVAVLVGAAAWRLGEGGAAGAKAKEVPPTLVNVIAPQRQDVPVVQQANGTVAPLSSVELHPQATSTIVAVHIKEGQFVAAGQLMFSLDDRSERANVDKAAAQLARDQAALADAERQLGRGQELVARKFIAQSQLDTLTSQAEAARALLAADRAALQGARVSAGYAAIRAPLAGRVGAINVYPGSLVQVATALTTVTRLDSITVAFALPESVLAELLAAQRRGAVAVEAQAGAGQPVAGVLSFIDNTVDAAAGTIRVKAQFANKDASLWPGQYVSARLTVRTLKDAVVIPQAAIIANTRGLIVYVVGADHAAMAVPVRRLYGFGPWAAVAGLNGDEQVITEGKQNLRPGAKVKLAGAAARRSAAGGAGAASAAAKDAPP